MRVNSFKNLFRNRGIKVISALVISICAFFLLAAFMTRSSDRELFAKRVNILMRSIGHDLLLHAGDSTSTIPPVVEKSDGVFLLRFQQEFTFQPDTLLAIVQQILEKTEFSRYTVTVHKCNGPDIVYGFEINPPRNNIKACRGRHQPKGCYMIEVAFADFPTPTTLATPAVITCGFLFVLAFVLIYKKPTTDERKPSDEEPSSPVEYKTDPANEIGKFEFDVSRQTLKSGDIVISLTDKECKILTLLNRNIGQLTTRDELIQEVWTDEGVITGRSLDMFISKLRKKLSDDPELRITNVHGRGYKLEIIHEST